MGRDVLGSASGSQANYPGHPPAAPGGLLSLLPDLVLGPRKLLDSGELQQPGRRGTTRFFGTGSRAVSYTHLTLPTKA